MSIAEPASVPSMTTTATTNDHGALRRYDAERRPCTQAAAKGARSYTVHGDTLSQQNAEAVAATAGDSAETSGWAERAMS